MNHNFHNFIFSHFHIYIHILIKIGRNFSHFIWILKEVALVKFVCRIVSECVQNWEFRKNISKLGEKITKSNYFQRRQFGWANSEGSSRGRQWRVEQWFTINFNTWWLNCACAGRVDWKSTKVNLTRLGRKFGIWNSKSESEFLKGTKRHRISSGRSEGERKWLIIPSTKLKANLKVSLPFPQVNSLFVMDGNTFSRVSIGCRKLETWLLNILCAYV